MGQEQERGYYTGIVSEVERAFRYHKIYAQAASMLPPADACPIILDLGCGPGIFASYLAVQGYREYVGIDFSAPLLANAIRNAPAYTFIYGDLRKPEIRRMIRNYQVIVALEFLEHVNEDTAILEQAAKGANVVFSVPSYDSAGHTRFFDSMSEVLKRYSPLIKVEQQFEIHGQKNEGIVNRFFLIGGTKT